MSKKDKEETKFKMLFNHSYFRHVFWTFVILFIIELLYEFSNISAFIRDPLGNINILSFYFVIGIIAILIVDRFIKASAINDVLFNTELRDCIDVIITESENFLILISPYIIPGNVLIESVVNASQRGVEVTIVHNTKILTNPEAKIAIGRMQKAGCKVYHHPRIHSKMYINDELALITSLNLVTGSFDNSFESGIVTNDVDTKEDILEHIEKDLLQSDLIQETKLTEFNISKGYCIRTKVEIPFDIHKPVEYTEYISSGYDKSGQFCHYCGKSAETNVANPFCEDHEQFVGKEDNPIKIL